MTRTLDVFLLPSLATEADLTERHVVVIDVLRATTTIATALDAGAREVVPCLEIEDAWKAAQGFAPGEALLGGERGGLPVEGFDLGNSPCEYTAQRIAGKSLVFTTTNGTRAMQRCRPARRVVLGAFVNGSAVVHALAEATEIALLCAGTAGKVTREDALMAGYLTSELASLGRVTLNDQANLARDAWRATTARSRSLEEELRDTQGGRNLTRLGLGHDIADAAQLDRFRLVPELNMQQWTIKAGA